MPIPDFHFYHGAAISQIVALGTFTGLARFEGGSAAYAINHDIGLYIKHSTLKNGPWQFNFSAEHQEVVKNLFRRYAAKTFIALVCCKVGVCLIEYGEYAEVLDENFEEQEILTVNRPRGGSFRVHGAAGFLTRTIPLNRFPEYIFGE